MAAVDLEEQEQISQIKGWWEQYGNPRDRLAVAVALASVGWQGWNWYQGKQTRRGVGALRRAAEGRQPKNAQKARGRPAPCSKIMAAPPMPTWPRCCRPGVGRCRTSQERACRWPGPRPRPATRAARAARLRLPPCCSTGLRRWRWPSCRPPTDEPGRALSPTSRRRRPAGPGQAQRSPRQPTRPS